jgi:hypothetical protein
LVEFCTAALAFDGWLLRSNVLLSAQALKLNAAAANKTHDKKILLIFSPLKTEIHENEVDCR